MDRIKKIKIKQQDGTLSDYYPIGADAQNIDFINGYSLDQIVGDINPDEDGTLEIQLKDSKIHLQEYIFLSNYNSFSDAIDVAFEENKILVIDQDLLIEEDFTISKSIYLKGQKNKWIILNKDAKTHLNIAADNVILDKVNIKTLHNSEDALPALGTGLTLTEGKNITIKNCHFYKLSYAIWMRSNDDNILEDIFITNNNIEKCELGVLCGPRIELESSVTFEIKNLLISNNYIHDGIGEVNLTSSRDGIKLAMRTYNTIISNNIIHGMKGDGIDCYTSGDTFIISDNEIFQNHLNGIELKSGGYDPTIYGNNQNCQICNNIFYGNGHITQGFAGVDIEFAYALDSTGTKQYSFRNAIIGNNIFREGVCAIDIQTDNIIVSQNIFNRYSDRAIRIRNARPTGVQSIYDINIIDNIFNGCNISCDANVKSGLIKDNIFDAFEQTIDYAIILSSSTITLGDNKIKNYNIAPISGAAGSAFKTIHTLVVPVGESGDKKLIFVPNRNISILSIYYLNNNNFSADTTNYAIARIRTDTTVLNTCTINSNYTKETKIYAPSSIKHVDEGTPLYLEHIDYGNLELKGNVVINFTLN